MSLYLDELQPVIFNSLDVSCPLEKIKHLSMDISIMKQAMFVQTNVFEDLRTVTADINQHLCVIEHPGLSRWGAPIPPGAGPELGCGECNACAWSLGPGCQRSGGSLERRGATAEQECHLCGVLK